MSVTLRDIAERVGKSASTVSRALGGYEDISLETRLEVQRVADEIRIRAPCCCAKTCKNSVQTP